MIVPIHWLLQSAADLPAGDDWLTASEAATLGSLRVVKRRNDWRLGRWTAKRAVVSYLRCALAREAPTWTRLEVRAAASGAPQMFLDRQPAPLGISLSHSAGRALCTVAGPDVDQGCDLERVEDRSAAFIADYFTDAERAQLAAVAVHSHAQVATLIWSAKESALKALGAGLRLSTRSVVVTLPNAAAAASKPPAAHGPCGPWSPQTLDAAGGRWQPLSTHDLGTGRIFNGWWRADHDYVLTVLASPTAALPLLLA